MSWRTAKVGPCIRPPLPCGVSSPLISAWIVVFLTYSTFIRFFRGALAEQGSSSVAEVASASPTASMAESEGDIGVVIAVTIIITLFIYWFFKKAVRTVRHAEVMIVERLGKYKVRRSSRSALLVACLLLTSAPCGQTTLKPGLHWLWPVIESPRKINWRYLDAANNSSVANVVVTSTDRIDMREHVIDFGRQHVITKDTVQILIDALVYFRITDPRVAVFHIQNLPDAVELLTQATLRNIVAQMTLDDTFSSREAINTQLLSKIQRDSERWGVTITRVEIFNILPPADIKSAMENQIRAERERRSTVLRADGTRESAVIKSRGEAARVVLSAEGARAASIARAQGDAAAKKLLASAEADCVAAIRDACGDSVRAVDYLAAVEYLNSLRNLTAGASRSEVVMVPTEAMDGIDSLVKLNTRPAASRRS